MKKSSKILTAAAAILLAAGCVLVPRVKTGAFEQKADQKQSAAKEAEDAHADGRLHRTYRKFRKTACPV